MKSTLSLTSCLTNSLWLLFLGLVILFAIVFNLPVAWFLVYLFTLILLLCLFSLRSRLSTLVMSTKEDIVVNQGQYTILEISLKRKDQKKLHYSYLKSTLYLADEYFELKRSSSKQGPLSTRELRFEVEGTNEISRGIYENGEIKLIAKDLFGLLRKERKIPLNQKIVVLPQRLKEDSYQLWRLLEQQQVIPLALNNQSSFDIRSFRDYLAGDSSKMVDWKLSAKKQQLVVKEWAVEKKEDILALFFNPTTVNFEQTLALFYSYSLLMQENNYKIPFSVSEPHSGVRLATKKLYSSLKPSTGESARELINQILSQRYYKQTILLFCGDVTQGVCHLVNSLSLNNQVRVITYTSQQAICCLKPSQLETYLKEEAHVEK